MPCFVNDDKNKFVLLKNTFHYYCWYGKDYFKSSVMKKIILYILFIGITVSSTLYAQHKSGIINYRGVINKKHVDSFLTDLNAKKDVPMHIKQGVVDMYNNARPDEFVLNFKNEESYYYHDPSLNIEGEYNIGSKAGTNSYYTNNTTNVVIEMSQSLGNIVHNPLNWEITNKTKTIGGYTCYKAIATEKLFSRKGYYYYRKAVAWFTPEIPLNLGPKYYNGLPGLVLEIERDLFTLTATKISLNPDKDIKIKRVKNNENVISEEESHHHIKELEEDRKKEYGG